MASVALILGTIFAWGKRRDRKRKNPQVAAVCQQLADRTSRHEFGELPPGAVRVWMTEEGVYTSDKSYVPFTSFDSFSIESPREQHWRVVFWTRDKGRPSRWRIWLLSSPLVAVPAGIWTIGMWKLEASHGFRIDMLAFALLGGAYSALIAMFLSKGTIQQRTSTLTRRVATIAGLFTRKSYTIDELAGFLKRYLSVEDSIDENGPLPTL